MEKALPERRGFLVRGREVTVLNRHRIVDHPVELRRIPATEVP